jgi:GNAT superfamily N-acetyltransferase
MRIQDLTTDAEIKAAFPVMVQLRTHLKDADELLARVRRQQAQGYQLTAVMGPDGPVALAGWRELDMLFCGPHIYVDDLVSDGAQRSQGHGKALLEHLAELGRAKGHQTLALDSGTQRKDAHRFYLRERFDIASFHFSKAL